MQYIGLETLGRLSLKQPYLTLFKRLVSSIRKNQDMSKNTIEDDELNQEINYNDISTALKNLDALLGHLRFGE